MFCFEKSAGAVVFRRGGNKPRTFQSTPRLQDARNPRWKVRGKIYFLLLHYRSGHWDFPKGHIEKGESEKQALRREVLEETGINDLKVMLDFKKSVYYFYRARGEEKEKRIESGVNINVFKKVAYYLAETETEEIKISFEHIGWEWLEYKEALRIITYRGSKRILKSAQGYLKS